MDLRAISALLLKLAGLLLVVQAITRAPSLFAYALRDDWGWRELLIMAALGVGPQLVAGGLFWFFPGTIANKIVTGPAASPNVEFRELQLIALAVLGVFLVANSLVEISQSISTFIALKRENPGAPMAPLVPRFVASMAGLLIGLGICIGRTGLSRQIDRLRGRDS